MEIGLPWPRAASISLIIFHRITCIAGQKTSRRGSRSTMIYRTRPPKRQWATRSKSSLWISCDMSESGYKQTSSRPKLRSALPPKPDIPRLTLEFRCFPTAEVSGRHTKGMNLILTEHSALGKLHYRKVGNCPKIGLPPATRPPNPVPYCLWLRPKFLDPAYLGIMDLGLGDYLGNASLSN